ncbi:hypothetical protein V1264_006321 [Littorina saxatilis]|uniref:Uncharacterized protein n=1 Tax=Littorina saxatilis TaxID=31220 RepID=A0AAN9AXL0_9CAEN
MICLCSHYRPAVIVCLLSLGLFGFGSFFSAYSAYPKVLWLNVSIVNELECTLQDFDSAATGFEISDNTFIQIRKHHLQDAKPVDESVVATVTKQNARPGPSAVNGSSVKGALKFGVGFLKYSFVLVVETKEQGDQLLKNSKYECFVGDFKSGGVWRGRFVNVSTNNELKRQRVESDPPGFVLVRRFDLTVLCTGTGLQFCNQSFSMSAKDNCEGWSSCVELGNERLGIFLQCFDESFRNCSLKLRTYFPGMREIGYNCYPSDHGSLNCSLNDKVTNQTGLKTSTSCTLAWSIVGILCGIIILVICIVIWIVFFLPKCQKKRSQNGRRHRSPPSEDEPERLVGIRSEPSRTIAVMDSEDAAKSTDNEETAGTPLQVQGTSLQVQDESDYETRV